MALGVAILAVFTVSNASTIPVARVLPLHSSEQPLFSTSSRQPISTPPFADLSHLLDIHPTQLLRLHRTELSSQFHARKPYLCTEPEEDQNNNKNNNNNAQEQQHSSPPLPKVPISLTGIPKDYGYTATFSIGTFPTTVFHPVAQAPKASPGQFFNLLVDTGSDLTVLTSSACMAPECFQVSNRFNCAFSSTCQSAHNSIDGTNRWIQGYGDGTRANGTLVRDTLRFVSTDNNNDNVNTTVIELTQQPLLIVDSPGLSLFKSYGDKVDGILGMNLGSPVLSPTVLQNLQRLKISTMERSSSSSSSFDRSGKGEEATEQGQQMLSNDLDNSIETAMSQTTTGMGLMSLALNKNLEPNMGGELLLNGLDTSRFNGSIYWSERGPSPFDWSIQLGHGGLRLADSSSRSSSSITLTTTPPTDPVLGTASQFAVIDSGSDGIYLHRLPYHDLFQRVPGAVQLKTGYWRVPCKGTTDLVLNIQGRDYPITYHDWVKPPSLTSTEAKDGGSVTHPMCQAKVYGSSPGPILLGGTFLRTVYTVFDFSRPGQERIGFADLI
ncbi:hypothetical protein BG004_001438 [Podila humilis]|nr:hypothetical protein BG004_001438 [Podila humilis]